MAPPRVFHLITRLLRGGAEAKTIETVLGLDGYDFTVGHGRSFDPEQVTRLESNGVDTVEFGLLRHYNPVTAVPAVASIARYLSRTRPDIVHTHSTEAGIIGRFAAAIANVPAVIHTVHGVPFTSDRNTVLNRFVLGCERRAAALSNRIVANGDAITREYLSLDIGRPDQYTTVYSGIDVEQFRTADPAEDLPGERPRVVMVGRLVEGKGFDILVDAVERLEQTPFSVCLVGDGPLAESLARTVERRGLDESVFLLGYRDDVPNVLQASDILVLPSYREGTPRVVTEAMAAGLPVVATDIAGIPEQVTDGESGYLIPTGDPAALADRLERLLTEPQTRQSFGRAAAERAELFSVDSMLADIDRVYQSVLSTDAER